MKCLQHADGTNEIEEEKNNTESNVKRLWIIDIYKIVYMLISITESEWQLHSGASFLFFAINSDGQRTLCLCIERQTIEMHDFEFIVFKLYLGDQLFMALTIDSNEYQKMKKSPQTYRNERNDEFLKFIAQPMP